MELWERGRRQHYLEEVEHRLLVLLTAVLDRHCHILGKRRGSDRYAMEEGQRRGVGDGVRVDDSLVRVSLELTEHQVLIVERTHQILPNGVESSACGAGCGIEEHERIVCKSEEGRVSYRSTRSPS